MSVLPDFMIRERLKGTYTARDHVGRLVKTYRCEDKYKLKIEPFCDYGECPDGVVSYGLSSGGYDLRVGNHFLIFSNTSACIIDPKDFKKESFNEITFPSHPFPLPCDKVIENKHVVIIPPNCFALAETVEYIEMPCDLIADIKGKSRLARAGYVLPTTPIEPSWRGKITLEIGNLSPLPMRVYAGEGIGQLVFYQLAGIPEKTYDQKPNSKFQDQKGLTGPMGT